MIRTHTDSMQQIRALAWEFWARGWRGQFAGTSWRGWFCESVLWSDLRNIGPIVLWH